MLGDFSLDVTVSARPRGGKTVSALFIASNVAAGMFHEGFNNIRVLVASDDREDVVTNKFMMGQVRGMLKSPPRPLPSGAEPQRGLDIKVTNDYTVEGISEFAVDGKFDVVVIDHGHFADEDIDTLKTNLLRKGGSFISTINDSI